MACTLICGCLHKNMFEENQFHEIKKVSLYKKVSLDKNEQYE